MNDKKANIKDISKITGLSASTISRVLNGKAKEFRISDSTVKLVMEVAKKLNYVPNQVAINLKTGKTKTIALIVPSLSNPFFANFAAVLNLELKRMGYSSFISDSNENAEMESEELLQVVARNVDGILISPCSDDDQQIEWVRKQGIPLVCFDRYYKNDRIPYVSTDNYRGAVDGTQYLLDRGHRRIACIQGSRHSLPNEMRRKGFESVMKEQGLRDYLITGSEFTVQNGYSETLLLLQNNEKPTAIFSFSNTIALGCIKAIREFELRIPDDISLLTFDNHPYLDYLETPLTCIAQPVSDICQIAIKLLFTLINDEEISTKEVLLRPKMIRRSSVKRLKA
jgi:LacI family transcriptional regulator